MSLQVLFTAALVVGVLVYLAWELCRTRQQSGVPSSLSEGPSSGRWGQHTAPIDWCEANYAWTELVAEFWNTITCVCYVFAGLVSLMDLRRIPLVAQRSAPMCYFIFCIGHVLTGIFSAVFHGTLWWWGQKLDEMWENITLLALLYMRFDRSALLVAVHGLFVCVGTIFIPEVFTEVHVAATVAAVLHVYYKLFTCTPHSDLQMYATRAATFGIIGFVCWLIDKIACGILPTTMQILQFHSWWHLFTALAIYSAGYGALLAHCLDTQCELHRTSEAYFGGSWIVTHKEE